MIAFIKVVSFQTWLFLKYSFVLVTFQDGFFVVYKPPLGGEDELHVLI